jgi:hypothetical protein
VLRAYLDASGKKNDDVVVVAGFVGWVSLWEEFEQRWRAFLDEFELDHFHATEFWSRKSPPYRNWSDAKHLHAKGEICKILSATRAIGVAVSLHTRVFDEWRATLDHYYPSDPYYFCLDRVLYSLVYMIKQGPKDDGITIYCDQEKEHELLGADIARWHEARLARDLSLASFPLDEPRPVSILYGPKRQFLPLQIADIYANDTFKKTTDYIRTGMRDEPYFTRCMKKNDEDRVTGYHYFDVGLLDADYKWRFRKGDGSIIVETSKLRFY